MPLLIDQVEDSRAGPAAAAACPSVSWGLGLGFGWSSLSGSDITARVTGTWPSMRLRPSACVEREHTAHSKPEAPAGLKLFTVESARVLCDPGAPQGTPRDGLGRATLC